VSFDAPDSVKNAMRRAIDENRSHYVQTTGIPRLLELLAEKMRSKNGIPVGGPEEVMVTTGGIHALYVICQALLEPGDEVLIPDPEWPPCLGNVKAAQGVPVTYRSTSRAAGVSTPRRWRRRSRRRHARST
jgi:aspartate aminotransferase